MSALPDKVVTALRLLIPAALMLYILTAAFGGAIRQRRTRNAIARRKTDPRQPWDRWLDEINRNDDEKKSGAIEKWRE